MSKNKDIGKALWFDLTIPNANEVKDFYSNAIGWNSTEHKMGDYSDYNMISPINGETLAGICHANGINKEMPPIWMVYFCVENLEEKIEFVKKNNGEILRGPIDTGSMGKYIVIKDPAGAICALWEKGK